MQSRMLAIYNIYTYHRSSCEIPPFQYCTYTYPPDRVTAVVQTGVHYSEATVMLAMAA